MGAIPGWLYLVLITASLAATVYAVVAFHWWQRRVYILVWLNLATAVFFVGLVTGYTVLAIAEQYKPPPDLLLLLLPYIFGLPALARFLELRRQERHRALSIEFRREVEAR